MNIRGHATIVTLVLAIAGLALPAAQAAPAQSPAHGAAGIESSDVISRYLRNRASDTSDVVSRYLLNRTSDTSDAVSRYIANVLRSSPTMPAQRTTLASSDGFNWNVALVGAGGTLAIVLILSATGIGVIRHRRSAPKSA